MKNLQKYGVHELNIKESKSINGGMEFADWGTYPVGADGQPIITPGTILGVTLHNVGTAAYNTVAGAVNFAQNTWNYLFG